MCLYRFWKAKNNTSERYFRATQQKKNIRNFQAYLLFADAILVATQGTEPPRIRSVTEGVHVPCAVAITAPCHTTCNLKMPSCFRIVAVEIMRVVECINWCNGEYYANVGITYMCESFLMKGVIVKPYSSPESSIAWSAVQLIRKYHAQVM